MAGQNSTSKALIIQFDVALSYRSDGTDHDLDSLVFSAWEDELDRADFVVALQV